MDITTPTVGKIFKSLLRADLTVQWRNRRASILSLIIPVVILISWQRLVATFGGPFTLSTCIGIGLISIGLLGYSNTIARDREKGVFQRLRVTPAPTWAIMASRLVMQSVANLAIALLVVIVGTPLH